MSVLMAPHDLSPDAIEAIEKQSLRAVFHACIDFGMDAYEVFRQSSDEPKDVAEDITREMLDRLGGYNARQRVYGNVDYRQARYVILPGLSVRQALFVDSKANLSRDDVRVQRSQLSLEVRQVLQGKEVTHPGLISPIEHYGGNPYLATTILAHYTYRQEAPPQKLALTSVTLLSIPNGLLQQRYNPTHADGIWKAGPHAPARNEEFRTRIAKPLLKAKAPWRIQEVVYSENGLEYEWED